MLNKINTNKAFTLIELLISVGLIIILVAIALLSFRTAVVRAKVAKAKSDMRTMASAIESYYVDYNNYLLAADSVEAGGGFMNGRGPTASFVYNTIWQEDGTSVTVEYGGFFKNLSTPVAYLANAFIEDPFARKIRVSKDVYNPEAPFQYMRFTAFNAYRPIAWHGWNKLDSDGRLVAAIEDPWQRGRPVNNYPEYSFSAATHPMVCTWALWSVGPDGDEGAVTANAGTPVHWSIQDYIVGMEKRFDPDECGRQWLDQVYDPSNGTVSGGNIWYKGGQKPKPDFYDTGPAIEDLVITQTKYYGSYRFFTDYSSNPLASSGGSGSTTNTLVYELKYQAGSGGSLSGNATQFVNSGEDGTPVWVFPSTGYHFTGWSDSTNDNPRTDLTVTGNIDVTANFALNQYTLTYSADTGGTITGPSPQTISHGQSGVPVTATADPGYAFTQWSDGITANPRTDTNVTGDKLVTANFAIAGPFTISYQAGPGGSIASGVTTQTISAGGDTTPVSVTADGGYHFTEWSDGVTDNPRIDTNITTSMVVTANFESDLYGSRERMLVRYDYQTASKGGEIGWIDPDGSKLIPLTDDLPAHSCDNAFISPDKTKIIYNFNDGGTKKIYVMDINGENKRFVYTLPSTPYAAGTCGWLDNNTVAYKYDTAPSVAKIYAVNIDGSNNRIIVDPNTIPEGRSINNPYLSESGKIVFSSREVNWGPRSDILISDGSGDDHVFYADSADNYTDVSPFWSKDGNTIYWQQFDTPGTGTTHFSILYKALSNREPVNKKDGVVIGGLSLTQYTPVNVLSPDGSQVLMMEYQGDDLYTLDLGAGTLVHKTTFPSELGSVYPRWWGTINITEP